MPDETQETVSSQVSVTSANIRMPTEFDFTKPETWQTWLRRFDRYISVANISSKSEKEKIDLLCYVMGEKSEDFLNQIMPTTADTTTLQTVKDKFSAYFKPKKNTIYERHKFNRRVQNVDETANSFITALHTLDEACEFGTLKEELIRDRIVTGVRDSKISERLQLTSDLTLEKAITMVRQAEIQAKETKSLRKSLPIENSEVNRVGSQNKKTHPNSKNKKFSGRNDTSKKENSENSACSRCGLRTYSNPDNCPALRSSCRKCQKKGHWHRVCKTKSIHRVEGDSDVYDAIFLGAITNNRANSKNEFLIELKLSEHGESVKFLVDTGADISCISEKTLPDDLKNKIRAFDKIIYGPDGKRFSVAGYIIVQIVRKKITVKAKFYVLRDLKCNLLGRPEIKNLNLISEINNLQSVSGKGISVH